MLQAQLQKMLEEHTRVLEEKDAKTSQLREQLSEQQRAHAEELSAALGSQLAQLLDSHKEEFELFRRDKAAVVMNYDRELTSMKEACESKVAHLQAQHEDSLCRLDQRSEATVRDLTARLDGAAEELRRSEQASDAVSRQMKEAAVHFTSRLSDLEAKHCTEIEALARQYEEGLSAQLQAAVDRSVELEESHRLLVRDMSCEMSAAVEAAARSAEEAAGAVYRQQLQEADEAHRTAAAGLLGQVAALQEDVEAVRAAVRQAEGDSEALKAAAARREQAYALQVAEAAAAGDLALSQLTASSQERVAEIEKRFERMLEDAQARHEAETASLKRASSLKQEALADEEAVRHTEALQVYGMMVASSVLA